MNVNRDTKGQTFPSSFQITATHTSALDSFCSQTEGRKKRSISSRQKHTSIASNTNPSIHWTFLYLNCKIKMRNIHKILLYHKKEDTKGLVTILSNNCHFNLLFIYLKIYLLLIYVYLFCQHVCVYSICVVNALGGQKIIYNPPELEVVTHHVRAQNQTWVFCKSSKKRKLGCNH